MHNRIWRALARTVVAGERRASPATGLALAQSGEVNVYTYREAKLIQPLLDAFTKDTGIKVNVISASSGLEQRIKTEGANSPADVLLTVDIGRIEEAVRAGITPADQVRRARQGRRAAIPRSGRPLVRHLDARARRLCLEGAREAERHHLRGTGRSEMEGQDLHPLRPAHLQQRAVRGLHRATRRGQDRGMAARASRPTWRRSPPAATARRRATSRPASATSASATPITGR